MKADDDNWGGAAGVNGINRMPFMFSDYGSVPTDPRAAQNVFFPPGMQTSGVEHVTGPNGTNIGPNLFDLLGGQKMDQVAGSMGGQQSFPSLLESLLSQGSITPEMHAGLLNLMKPKEQNTNFTAAPPLANGGRG